MTWIMVALYIAAAYLAIAAVITVLAKLGTALPMWIAVLSGITWGPVLVGDLIDAARGK
jgi:hypothetical protein